MDVKREIKKPEIGTPPITLIQKKAFEKGDGFPPLPSFNADQVGDLPEIQLLLHNSSIKTPKETCILSPRIFFPMEDSK